MQTNTPAARPFVTSKACLYKSRLPLPIRSSLRPSQDIPFSDPSVKSSHPPQPMSQPNHRPTGLTLPTNLTNDGTLTRGESNNTVPHPPPSPSHSLSQRQACPPRQHARHSRLTRSPSEQSHTPLSTSPSSPLHDPVLSKTKIRQSPQISTPQRQILTPLQAHCKSQKTNPQRAQHQPERPLNQPILPKRPQCSHQPVLQAQTRASTVPADTRDANII